MNVDFEYYKQINESTMAAKYQTQELEIPIPLFSTESDEKCNGQVSNCYGSQCF